MKIKTILSALMMGGAVMACSAPVSEPSALRAPAYPLVSIDPYTSAWSMTDNLYDSPVRHWTGQEFTFIGAVRVDGQVYRFMGVENPELETVVPSSLSGAWDGRYTESRPVSDWAHPEFNDAAWKQGKGAFGIDDAKKPATLWETDDIWVRREVELDEDLTDSNVYLKFSNDDGAVYYVNGVEVVATGQRVANNEFAKLPEEAVKTLKKGRNVLAATCHNDVGLAFLDFSLLKQKKVEASMPQTAVQKSVDVQPMQTKYAFACGGVDLNLTFTAPLFLDNLDLVSRPVNYVSYEAVSNDGKSHEVQVYFEASPLWAVHDADQQTVSETYGKNGIVYLKTGTKTQEILGKKGDDVRIDWGYFYLAAENAAGTQAVVGTADELKQTFIADGTLSGGNAGENKSGELALVQDLGTVSKPVSGKVLIGYDDIYSIQYFGTNLRPYWNNDGSHTIEEQFEAAFADYSKLMKAADAFDADLMANAEAAGGRKYAELCALAYRQAIHAHKLVLSPEGELLFFSKENNSNGSIGTVDITYPSSPLFLLYNPELAKGLMNHIYHYSESGRWTKPFPAHDVGTYPIANGQTYGGDMPVEEAGNMIITTAAVCYYTGETDYAQKHWDVLTTWTEYLSEFGLDPENQLCTDDFAGHFAHNVNLSVKAILGIASYGYMAGLLGYEDVAGKYTAMAKEMAEKWMEMADDGDHYRLTFDKPGTWSQKYNLVWDKLLHFGIFPESVAEKEIAYYLDMQNKYGLPLDNRETYTKLDWILWTATLANNREDFEAFVDPVYKFENETVTRVPMSDWVFTDKPEWRGFKARSVVGGLYIKMLENK